MKELERRIARLEAATIVKAQRRTSLRDLSNEELYVMIDELAEQWMAGAAPSPVVDEVRSALAAGNRREVASILGRVFAKDGTAPQ